MQKLETMAIGFGLVLIGIGAMLFGPMIATSLMDGGQVTAVDSETFATTARLFHQGETQSLVCLLGLVLLGLGVVWIAKRSGQVRNEH